MEAYRRAALALPLAALFVLGPRLDGTRAVLGRGLGSRPARESTDMPEADRALAEPGSRQEDVMRPRRQPLGSPRRPLPGASLRQRARPCALQEPRLVRGRTRLHPAAGPLVQSPPLPAAPATAATTAAPA